MSVMANTSMDASGSSPATTVSSSSESEACWSAQEASDTAFKEMVDAEEEVTRFDLAASFLRLAEHDCVLLQHRERVAALEKKLQKFEADRVLMPPPPARAPGLPCKVYNLEIPGEREKQQQNLMHVAMQESRANCQLKPRGRAAFFREGCECKRWWEKRSCVTGPRCSAMKKIWSLE